jgi:hypothetical protein
VAGREFGGQTSHTQDQKPDTHPHNTLTHNSVGQSVS